MPHVGPRTHTPGYLARQEEERERSGSLQSSVSGLSPPPIGTNASTNMEQTSPPPQQPASQRLVPTHKNMSFPGAIPNIDWGTIDLAGSTSNLQQGFSGTEPYNFNDYVPAIPSGPANSALPDTNPANEKTYQADTTSPPAAVAMSGFTTNSSPMDTMDALNDIDWVRGIYFEIVEKLMRCRTRLI
jgi:hypothetical protein